MEIITTAAAATAAKSNSNSQAMASSNYSKSLMASRALKGSGVNNEVSIAALEKGDVFKGEITNITGKSVTVSLGNGQVLTALLMENVPINIGNSLYFEVKENTGDTVTIRPLLDEKFSPQNQTIEKSLQSAGLQLNEKNMAVVKELMDANMPIDRNSIMKVLQHLVNHPEASIKTIIDMMRCNIPINDVNVRQFQQYQNHNAQLNTQINSVTNGILSTYEALAMPEAPQGDLVRFNQYIINTFTETSMEEPLPTLFLKDVFVMEDGEVDAFYQRMGMMETDGEGNVLKDASGNTYPKGSILMNEEVQPVLDNSGKFTFDPKFVEQVIKENPELTKEQVLSSLAKGEFNINSGAAFTNEIQSAFAEQLKSLGIHEDAIKVMLDPKNTSEDLMKAVHDYISNNKELSDSAVKNFFSSKEYAVLIESVIDRQWKLNPEQMKSPKEVDQLFERIAEQSSKLMSAGEQFFGGAGEQMEQNAKDMNENIQFMKDLNENYTFAQIPIQLSNQDANSELYVYTNKKSLAMQKKDISVMLHLDMDYLGSTDVYVQLNGKKVNARFYLEDGRSMSIVKNHIDELQKQIEKLGLTLETEVVKRVGKKEQIEDLVEDFLAKEIPASQQIKRYTFDVRA